MGEEKRKKQDGNAIIMVNMVTMVTVTMTMVTDYMLGCSNLLAVEENWCKVCIILACVNKDSR